MLLDTQGKLVLISLETPDYFIFELFPTRDQGIQETDRVNWEPQDVSIGTKLLFYSNSELRKISIPEVILEGTRTNESIGPQIDKLRALKNELPKAGAPPALLVVYGDRQQRCVMEEVSITQTVFTPAGNPLRARVSLQLIELQEEHEAVSVTVKEVDLSSGIGNF